jgi:RNA ligase (TIGR02306 family)
MDVSLNEAKEDSMALFECKVMKIDSVENHANADKLTVNRLAGFTCISNKKDDGSWRYESGNLVVYIPENALLPEWLLKAMHFWDDEKQTGTLAGRQGNRVKPIRLRGIYSEGLILPLINNKTLKNLQTGEEREYHEGDDVTDFLGVTKYEPQIPTHLSGEMYSMGTGDFFDYDIDSIQRYPDIFENGEEVEFTEKLHGTQVRIACTFGSIAHPDAFGERKDIHISSKGLGAQGKFFKNDEKNCYVKAFIQSGLEEKLAYLENDGTPVTFYGEIVGVQDLKYGLQKGKTSLRIFDIFIGNKRDGNFYDYIQCKDFCEKMGLERVPSLYIGAYSEEKVKEYTSGNTQFAENLKQIREGIVIRPLRERQVFNLGRVILKSVSEDYKLRKGETTEFN